MRRSVGFNATAAEIDMMDRQVIEARRNHPEVPFTRSDYIRQATLRSLAEDAPVKIRERRRETVASAAVSRSA